MKYLKKFEGVYDSEFEEGDIVVFKFLKQHGINIVKENVYFVIKKHDGFGGIYWYDLEKAYENEFAIMNKELSVEETKIEKIPPDLEEEIRLDLETNKYNI